MKYLLSKNKYNDYKSLMTTNNTNKASLLEDLEEEEEEEVEVEEEVPLPSQRLCLS